MENVRCHPTIRLHKPVRYYYLGDARWIHRKYDNQNSQRDIWEYSRLRERRKHIALQPCHDRWGTVFTGLELICNAYYAIGSRRNRSMAMETRKADSS